MRAWLNLRHAVPARHTAFVAGLKRCGYQVVEGFTSRPADHDICVTWNRITEGGRMAQAFESRGLPVIVAENASWGNDFANEHWYTLARGYHNTVGCFPVSGSERWDSLDIELQAWRTVGGTVILPQRGIGPQKVAMPLGWPADAQRRHGGHIRLHPGREINALPLHIDLAAAGHAVTWGSGAAVKALLWGIPVSSEMPGWIAEQDNTDAGRLAMFRRLAWAQWRLSEITSGEPFKRLLEWQQ